MLKEKELETVDKIMEILTQEGMTFEESKGVFQKVEALMIKSSKNPLPENVVVDLEEDATNTKLNQDTKQMEKMLLFAIEDIKIGILS